MKLISLTKRKMDSPKNQGQDTTCRPKPNHQTIEQLMGALKTKFKECLQIFIFLFSNILEFVLECLFETHIRTHKLKNWGAKAYNLLHI